MEVITLHPTLFTKHCLELAEKIDVNPDVVIGIQSGGVYVLNEMKDFSGFKDAKFVSIAIKKEYNHKPFKKRIAPLLKYLPTALLNSLRRFEMRKRQRRINQNQPEFNASDFELDTDLDAPQTIVVVDDAVDSGKTLCLVTRYLKTQFPQATIKTAVLTWTLDNPIVQPNFYIFKNTLCRFPWSFDYKS